MIYTVPDVIFEIFQCVPIYQIYPILRRFLKISNLDSRVSNKISLSHFTYFIFDCNDSRGQICRKTLKEWVRFAKKVNVIHERVNLQWIRSAEGLIWSAKPYSLLLLLHVSESHVLIRESSYIYDRDSRRFVPRLPKSSEIISRGHGVRKSARFT